MQKLKKEKEKSRKWKVVHITKCGIIYGKKLNSMLKSSLFFSGKRSETHCGPDPWPGQDSGGERDRHPGHSRPHDTVLRRVHCQTTPEQRLQGHWFDGFDLCGGSGNAFRVEPSWMVQWMHQVEQDCHDFESHESWINVLYSRNQHKKLKEDPKD